MRLNQLWTTALLPLILTGCVPNKTTFKHVLFSENPAIQILERSYAIERNVKGRPLKDQVTGLPVRSQLVRPAYRIDISTPINAEPVVFLRVSNQGQVLQGSHLRPIQGDYQYSFLLAEAHGSPLHVDILDQAGKKLGTENLPYTLVKRGHTWSIDAP